IKDFQHGAEILLDNGFKTAHDDYFQYNCVPLIALGPIKLGDFKSCLLAQQQLLHGMQLTTLLDEAIVWRGMVERKEQPVVSYKNDCSILRHHRMQLTKDQFDDNVIGVVNILGNQGFQGHLEDFESVNHLNEITKMSSGMIFAQLAEKYTNVPDGFNHNRTFPPSSRIKEGSSQAHHTPEYVSPYNLNERAKKSRAPGGPDMPCICDPECMCAPLCASDLTQNCLCEDNGLFVRVTEGVDIDDLDVPDLVRQERPASASSSSHSSSNCSKAEMPPNHTETVPLLNEAISAWGIAFNPTNDEDAALQEVGDQRFEQVTQAANHLGPSTVEESSADQFDDILSIFDSSLSSTSVHRANPCYWGTSQFSPPRHSSLAYRDALIRPFSKECDTPPKRQSTRSVVAKHLFNTSTTVKSAERNMSAVSNALRIISADSGRIAKQETKRALPDVSLRSFKRTFHRGQEDPEQL
ncbi:MAG: hypothetical protein Q9164_006423, partial [Protoblastenia rupestris]